MPRRRLQLGPPPQYHIPNAAPVSGRYADWAGALQNMAARIQRERALEAEHTFRNRELGLRERLLPGQLEEQGLRTSVLRSTLEDSMRERAERAKAPSAVSSIIDAAMARPDRIERPGALDLEENPEAAGINAFQPGRPAARTVFDLFSRGVTPDQYDIAAKHRPTSITGLGLMTPEAAQTKDLELAKNKRIEGIERELEGLDVSKPESLTALKAGAMRLAIAKGDTGKLLEILTVQSPADIIKLAEELRAKVPGTRVQPKIDEKGRVSATLEADAPSVDRMLIEKAKKKYPDDEDKQIEWINKQKAAQAGAIEREKVGAQVEGRPLEATDRQAVDAYNDIISSAELLKTFSDDEIKAFTGAWQRGVKDIGQFISNLPFGSSLVKPDQRYADFRALMGRFEGTAFGEGGKQLTGLERKVVMAYTPNGKETGGAVEMRAKVKQLEAFTRVARKVRLEVAKTGKGALDPDAIDAMLRTEMQKAGLPIPGEGKAATPGQGADAPKDEMLDLVGRANAIAKERYGQPYGNLDDATRRKIFEEISK